MTDAPNNATTTPETPPTEPTQGVLRSKVSQKWSLRMILIGVVLVGFGVAGLLDAIYFYPKRGAQASEWYEYQYLDQYQQAHNGTIDGRAGVADIGAVRDVLKKQEAQAETTAVDRALTQWLDSLKLIGQTEAATATAIPRTDFRGDQVTDAKSRLVELAKRWTSASGAAKSPNPLSTFDIPVQWVITAAGFGIGIYLFMLVTRVRSRVFTFDTAAQRLTLPNGKSFVPGDIEDVDKRRWHKLYVDIKIKPGHAGDLGGKNVDLDLLRYEPVEAWVLEMEKTAFPDRAAKEEAEALAANSEETSEAVERAADA
ncbi:MAG: hypothetical protein WC718_10255 [Phycisphaerales bacterium]|jgi:hypothetical protein